MNECCLVLVVIESQGKVELRKKIKRKKSVFFLLLFSFFSFDVDPIFDLALHKTFWLEYHVHILGLQKD